MMCILSQQSERPSVDGDVVSGGQNVQKKERARQRGHTRFVFHQPLYVRRYEYQQQSCERNTHYIDNYL
jgi:hypothetical protein